MYSLRGSSPAALTASFHLGKSRNTECLHVPVWATNSTSDGECPSRFASAAMEFKMCRFSDTDPALEDLLGLDAQSLAVRSANALEKNCPKMKKAGEESPAAEAQFYTWLMYTNCKGSVKYNFQTVVAQFPVSPAGSDGRCNTIWYNAVFKGGVYEARETVWAFGGAEA
jgi:hypothetical protein